MRRERRVAEAARSTALNDAAQCFPGARQSEAPVYFFAPLVTVAVARRISPPSFFQSRWKDLFGSGSMGGSRRSMPPTETASAKLVTKLLLIVAQRRPDEDLSLWLDTGKASNRAQRASFASILG